MILQKGAFFMWFDTILWLAAIVAFIAAEAATTALVSVWFAVGAAAAMVVSLFTVSFGWQLLVFAVVSAVTLALMVPGLLRRRGHAQPPVTNGSPQTLGQQGVVLVDIEPGMPGRVRGDGLDWQARAGVPLAKCTRCQVTAVDGAVLIVVPVTADAAAV